MRALSRFLSCLSAAFLAACPSSFDGGAGLRPSSTSGSPDPTKDLPEGGTLEAAPTQLHSLTTEQYRNTIRDLLGLSEQAVGALTVPTAEAIPSLLTVTKLDEGAAAITALGAHRKVTVRKSAPSAASTDAASCEPHDAVLVQHQNGGVHVAPLARREPSFDRYFMASERSAASIDAAEARRSGSRDACAPA